MSLRLRLTGWYLLLLLAILGAFSLSVYLGLAHAVRSELDSSLATVGHLLVEEVKVHDGRIEPDFDTLPPDLKVAAYGPGLLFQNDVAPPTPPPLGYATVTLGGQAWRQLAVPVGPGGTVVVWRSEEALDALLAQLRWRLLWTVPVTLLVAAGGGLFLASRALGPIDEVTRTAAAIEAAADLRQRLRPVAVRDELGRLVSTFNAMLERLESAFARQRHFTADAAHQLRTPLAVIRGRAEVTLTQPRTPAEYQDALGDIFQHSEHMTNLVARLLRLARGDAGVPIEREHLDLAVLAGNVAESLRARAEEAGIALEVGPLATAPVLADETGLTELIFNLVDNALKYTPAGGKVQVGAGPGYVEVRDTGRGIPADQLELVFERFHRLDAGTDGTGLGLALCQAVARQHGGEVRVTSRVGEGSVFTFRM